MFKIGLFLCGLLIVAATIEAHEGESHQDSDENNDENSEDKSNPNNDSEDASDCDEETTTLKADCGLSENRALHKVIRELTPLLPRKRLENIVANAAACDKEVRHLLKVMRSKDFRKKLERLRETKEYRKTHEYICRIGLNYGFYIDFLRIVMNLHTKKKLCRPLKNARPGICGMLHDLTDALPQCEIKEVYDRLYKENDDLANTDKAALSKEWKTLIGNYRKTKAYHDVRKTLEDAGVPIWTVMWLVDTALGWDRSIDRGPERAFWEV